MALPVLRKEVVLLSEKRRDSKGRILHTGESQRSDSRYQYRYKDINGKRRTIYDLNLNLLREKEKEIQKQLSIGVSCFDGRISLCDLLEKAMALKQNWAASTRRAMESAVKMIEDSALYHMSINKIKKMDIKGLYAELNDANYSYKTITTLHCLLNMSFEMACEDDAILKNPCSFPLKSVIDDNTQKIQALTKEQENSLRRFLEASASGKKFLDVFKVLLGTGLRIGEFAALTIKDIDFAHNVIHVNKQLLRIDGHLTIAEPKSKAGYRDIPMTKEVRLSMCNLIEKRKAVKKDVMLNGYVGFLSVSRSGQPRASAQFSNMLNKIMKIYNRTFSVRIEKCTPHVLRHTFCTRCVSAGMDIKTVQYLMGHSNINVTLSVYADSDFDSVVSNMKLLENEAG